MKRTFCFKFVLLALIPILCHGIGALADEELNDKAYELSVQDSICPGLPPYYRDRPLTLVELTDVALTCNPTTYQAWAQTRIALTQLGIAYSAYWPQINGTGRVNYIIRSNNNNRAGVTLATASGTGSVTASRSNAVFTYGPGITMSYLLFDFGVRGEQVNEARYQLEAATFSENENFQQVILQVEQAYYQVLGDQALVNADTINLNEAITNYNAAQALHTQGISVIGDVYQSQSAMQQAELTLQQAQGNLMSAKGALATAVGIPVQTPLDLVSVPKDIDTKKALASLQELLNIAKTQRPDLLAAEATVRAAEANFNATKLQQWPTITLNTNTQETYPTTLSGSGLSNNILLTVNIPLFTGFAQTYEIEQARLQTDVAEAQREQLAHQVDLQVWQAYYALETAAKALDSNQALLQSSIVAAKQAYGQYKAGVGNILTVLSTQSTQANARAQLIQAKLNWYVALAQLSSSLGDLTNIPPIEQEDI